MKGLVRLLIGFLLRVTGVREPRHQSWGRDLNRDATSGADPGLFAGGVNDGCVQRAPSGPAPTGV